MKTIGKYLAILIAVVLLWNQVILKPFRVLSMLFHKMGHAVVAFLFGYGSNAFEAAFGQWETQWLAHKGGFLLL